MVPVCIRGTFEALSRHDRYVRTGRRLQMKICEAVQPRPEEVDLALQQVESRIRTAARELDG